MSTDLQPQSSSQNPIVSDESVSPGDKKLNRSSVSLNSTEKLPTRDANKLEQVDHDNEEAEAHHERQRARWQRFRPFVLTALALLILGWWISATVLPATRHRW